MVRSALSRLVRFDSEQTDGMEGEWAGVDEAGCGPLAGPVVASAVILRDTRFLSLLNDSKKVSSQLREELYPHILQNAEVGIGVVEVEEIDTLNIYHAARLAMKKAVLALSLSPCLLLIDGRGRVDLPLSQKTVVKGDSKSACIAAASIVAKVTRDALMVKLDQIYPQYGFKKHKGYGTAFHLARLRETGLSPAHRKSFAPVRELLSKQPYEILA